MWACEGHSQNICQQEILISDESGGNFYCNASASKALKMLGSTSVVPFVVFEDISIFSFEVIPIFSFEDTASGSAAGGKLSGPRDSCSIVPIKN